MSSKTNGKWIDRFSMYTTRHRVAVMVFAIIVAVIMGSGIFRIKGEVLLEELLPYDHQFLKIIIEFSEVFGTGGSAAIIMVQATDGDIFNTEFLKKVQGIDREVADLRETYRSQTFSIASRSMQVTRVGGSGVIEFEPLMHPDVPGTPQGLAALKKDIFSDRGIRGLVSEKGDITIVVTEFKPDVNYERSAALLNEIVATYSDENVRVETAGFPVLMGWIYGYKSQIIFVMAVSTALILLIIFIIFRNFSGMAAPALFGVFSTACGLGFIGWTGINFSPLLYVLAFLVGARMVSHAVQVTHRYMEELAEREDRIEACYETMRRMILPNWAGVVTDGAGFLILIMVKIALMQQVAIFMSFWMFTVAFCGPMTPIICSFMPLRKASEEYMTCKVEMGLWDRICMGSARFSVTRGRFVVALVCLAVLVFSAFQTTQLQIGDPTPGTSLFWPEHPFNRTVAKINENLNVSTDDLVLYFKGNKEDSVYHPEVFQTFEAFDRHMRDALPDIYKSSDSFGAVMKTLHEVLRDGDMVYHELPRSSSKMDNLIGMARSSVQTATLQLYFDAKMQMSQLSIYFTDHTSTNLLRIRDAAYDFFSDRPMKIETGEFLMAGGAVGMEMATNEEMKRTHTNIDLMVLGTILIICSLFYRSIVAGLMLTGPLVIGNLVAFCFMSLNDIGLSINTLPVAAVGVGVGVDFAIYIYNRCKEEFAVWPNQPGCDPTGDRWLDSILISVRTSGKAVVFTGLTMVLPILCWLFLSDLKFQAQMGLFLAMILTTNVVLAMTLHPLMLYVIKPGFIGKTAENGEVGVETFTAEEAMN